MNSFISYKQYKKSSTLNETYESYVELKELADNIFENYNKFFLFRKFQYFKIYYLNDFVTKKFKTIQDFINNGNIGITYNNPTKQSSVGGFYAQQCEFDKFELSKEKIEDLKQKINGLIVIRKLRRSIILHELNHAYDDYRSHGKFVEHKRQKKFIKLSLPDINDLTGVYKSKEEYNEKYKKFIQKQSKYFTSYSRNPHEISSYFVQTIRSINFFIDKKQMILKDIHILWDEFKEKYQDFKVLTPNMKKDLARKFSQYYYKLKERNIGDE